MADASATEHAPAIRDTLDYLLARIAQVEALCGEIGKVRRAVERARARLDELERGGEIPLSELKAILDRVEEAQLEWEEFAARLGAIWTPRRVVH